MLNALLIAALLAFLLAIHPFVTFPLSLLALRRLKRADPIPAPGSDAPLPSLSVCFCGYNEQAVVADKVRNLETMAERYPGEVQVLAYTDGCTDDTYRVACEAATRTQVVEGTARLGKSGGMNKLLAMATGEVVVFTDANVTLADGALAALAGAFADPRIGCASGTLVYTNPGEGHVATLGSFYWRLEEWIKKLESQTGSTMGADGALFSIRRELYREVPVDIIDDMFTSLSILCDGKRVVSVPDAVAYEKTATSSGDEFRRKVRIACRCFNCHRLLQGRLLRLGPLDQYKYVSHKLVRWLVIFWLALSAALLGVWCGLAGYGAHFAVAAAVAAVALTLGAFGAPKLRSINEVLSSFTAVGVGVLHSLQGRRYQTWRPPQSTR